MDTNALAPAPTNVPNAVDSVISGKVSASPEMANGPMPWPMKMRSMMLYKATAVVATMAGIA